MVSGFKKSSVRIVAIEDSYAVFMSASDCLRFFEENFEFYKLVTKKISQKLYMNSYKHGVFLSYPSKFILAKYIIEKYERDSRKYLRILETRETIAEATGVNIRTLNRAVKGLIEDKLINIDRGKIYVNKDSIQRLKYRLLNYDE